MRNNTSMLIILFGGESRERLVSVATAQNMSTALPEAACWFWAPDDQVYLIPQEELLAHQDVFKKELMPKAKAKFETIFEALDSEDAKQSVFVLGVHGGRGEDGTLQAWLEERKLAFTASGSKACYLCMNKNKAKEKLQAKRVRVAQSCLLEANQPDAAAKQIKKMLSEIPQLILKPNAEGSSFGVLRVTQDNMAKAIQELKSNPDREYLLEEYIHGTELAIGVCDRPSGIQVLPPTELRSQGGLADYDGKYLGLGTEEITPAEVPESVTLAAQRIALVAHDTLGCEGYSRSDIMVDSKGPVFLETNSLPGMTKSSLVPQGLAAEGISIREFLLEQVELARERHRRSL